MLYYLLKPIVTLSLRTFFRRIHVIDGDKLPEKGPAILVSNHSSAFIDPLLIVILVRRKLSFIAGAEWFGTGFKSWIFRKQFNMLPVYRPWLKKNVDKSNKDMFADVYTSLENGNCVVIYPEASSVTISRIRELKTGAVRMKLGAEEISKKNIEVPIIPVGIQYEDAHKFRSDLVVKVGDPVDFSDIDKNLSGKELAKAMTAKVRDDLKEQIVNIENPEHEPLIQNIFSLFATTLIDDSNRKRNKEEEFKLEQDIAKAVEYFDSSDPDGFLKIDAKIQTYLKEAHAIGLDANQADPGWNDSGLSKLILLVLGFPVFLLGFILNVIPYFLTRLLFNVFIKPNIADEYIQGKLNPSFTGSLIFALGMFIFLVWTLGLVICVGTIGGSWLIAAILLVVGYPLLELTFSYLHLLQEYRMIQKGRRLRRKHSNVLSDLEKKRQSIIEELEAYRAKYDNRKTA